jgi:hypothetical protein
MHTYSKGIADIIVRLNLKKVMGSILEVALLVSGFGGLAVLHEYVSYREDEDERDRYDEGDQYDE